MFQNRSFPNAILHLDGDAFFATVWQAVYPNLKGKPVVTGSERGLATAVSYEARKYGVKRGMLIWQIKKICPQCFILPSDYQLYSLFSRRMFDIIRDFTFLVEEYSIDEGFANIKGLQKLLHMSYEQIGRAIRDKINSSLGISVSVGISLTKSLAKLASSWQKPYGLTIISGQQIEKFLQKTKIESVWGIGENTSHYLKKLGINTALDFALKSQVFVEKHLNRPFLEIWKELRGEKVYQLDFSQKTSYQDISHTRTFTPPTSNKDILWAKLLFNIEEAFKKARRLGYSIGKISLFLKTESFQYHSIEIKLPQKVAYPLVIRQTLRQSFEKIWQNNTIYRATGVHISDFQEANLSQMGLFSDTKALEEKAKKIYPLYEANKIDFGTRLFDKKNTACNTIKRLKIPLLSLNF